MHAVRFKHVSKRYRLGQTRVSLPGLAASWMRRLAGRPEPRSGADFDALRDVTFEVAAGESVALVGANGAGKTTALKLMAGITRPSAGTVQMRGRLSALIELGAGFHGDLTGRENVFLNGAILGLGRAEVRRRFDDIVGFAELGRFVDTPVKRYSSGMIVRLGFAVAASIEPDVLLVDEVLAVGDAAFSQKCLARIQRLSERGTTLVFVSHNPYLVRAACRTAVYLRQGQVRLVGAAAEVLRAYDHDIVERRVAAEGTRRRQVESVESDDAVAITGVDLVFDGVRNPDTPVSSDAEAEVRIHWASRARGGRVQAAVFVRRADGLICCSARSGPAGASLRLGSTAGTISVRLARLQLTGGAYCVDAYLLDQSDVVVLTPGGAQSAWFTVAGRGLASTDDAGVFEPAVRWSQEDAVPSGAAVVGQ